MVRVVFNDWFNWINDDFGAPSNSFSYGLFNPQTHELVPRQEYKKELIAQMEKELENLDKKREELKAEIKKLKE